MGGVLSPDGQQVFISLGRAGAVAVIDVAGRKVVRTIEGVGARPWGVALNADGTKLYTGVLYRNPAPPPTYESEARARQEQARPLARPRHEILEMFRAQ